MSNNNKNFAIIGGGSIGPLQLISIALEAERQDANLSGHTFHVIDPEGFGNGGIAYGQSLPGQILNSVCSEMDPQAQGTFIETLQDRGVKTSAASFNERADYQPYIQEHLVARAIEILHRRGANVVEHKQKAYIRLDNDGLYSIVDSDPADTAASPQLINDALTGLTADNFVLTVGYGANTNFENLQGQDGYIHNIYDKQRRSLEEREPRLREAGVRIAVAGSGPGLYDVTNSLQELPGALNVFSRSGHRLSARDVSVELDEISIPPQALLALNEQSTLDDALKALDSEFNESAQGRSERRIALDINKSLREILLSLSVSVAKEFRCSEEFAAIKGKATPVPQESIDRADILGAQFHKARLNGNIKPQDDGTFEIDVNGQIFTADVVINVTGHGRHNAPIIESLKSQGLVSVDERTGALATDETGYRTDGSELAIIGAATHVGTDGIESFHPYTVDLARHLITGIRAMQDNNPQFTRRPVPAIDSAPIAVNM